MKRQPVLTAADARAILDMARAEAERLGVEVTIAIVDAAGVLLALARLDGARLHTPEGAILKAHYRDRAHAHGRAAEAGRRQPCPAVLPRPHALTAVCRCYTRARSSVASAPPAASRPTTKRSAPPRWAMVNLTVS